MVFYFCFDLFVFDFVLGECWLCFGDVCFLCWYVVFFGFVRVDDCCCFVCGFIVFFWFFYVVGVEEFVCLFVYVVVCGD